MIWRMNRTSWGRFLGLMIDVRHISMKRMTQIVTAIPSYKFVWVSTILTNPCWGALVVMSLTLVAFAKVISVYISISRPHFNTLITSWRFNGTENALRCKNTISWKHQYEKVKGFSLQQSKFYFFLTNKLFCPFPDTLQVCKDLIFLPSHVREFISKGL